MRNFLLFLFFGFGCIAFGQELGTLIHFQRECTGCLALAGEKYNATKFTILVPDAHYSGGRIVVKKVRSENFTVKKALFLFNAENYTKTEFLIKGKKNKLAYKNWEASKVKPDASGNSSFRSIDNKQVIYQAVAGKRKLRVTVEYQTGF